MEQAIGIYDSGVGGLSVLRELKSLLPHHDFLYYADTAHMPYGGRSQDEIIIFSRQIIDFLGAQGAQMIVVACNTSSAIALPALKTTLPLVGMIEPAVKATGDADTVGILATAATVHSRVYPWALAPKTTYSVACPLLVPLVEGGTVSGSRVRAALNQYTAPLLALDVETIILGCTHYPFLCQELKEIVGQKAQILDPALVVAKEAEALAKKLMIGPGNGITRYYTSGDAAVFRKLAGKLLGTDPGEVSKVDLEEANVKF